MERTLNPSEIVSGALTSAYQLGAEDARSGRVPRRMNDAQWLYENGYNSVDR